MSSGILSIANSALSAAYTALRTTGNNIANANTPGYTRQIVEMAPQQGSSTGGIFLGQGVVVADVKRVYDALLAQQANQATALSSAAEARYQQLAQMQNMFSDPTSGVGASIDQFFGAMQQLSQNPADSSSRQAVLSAADQLVSRFNDAAGRLQDFRSATDRQLQLETGSVNSAVKEIAQLNDRITLALGSGNTPNDLLDQRDAAIRRLSESLQVSTVTQSDGAVNLFLANGQALVVGSQYNQLVLTNNSADPQGLQVAVSVGGQVQAIDPSRLGGGKIAGLMQFRSEDLPRLENELGRIAVSLSSAVNAQHRLGNDRNGLPGGDFFAPLSASVYAAPGNGNPATQASVSFVDTTQLQASDYRLVFSGGQYTLTRLSDGTQWQSSTPSFTQDGLSISLSNTPPANGDSFLIQPVRSASRSLAVAITQPSDIAAASPIAGSIPSSNTGSVAVDDLSVLAPRSANVAVPATITFGPGGTYTITSGAVTQAGTYAAGQPISFDGRWSITLRGAAQPGDVINIGPNNGGTGDNSNLLKLTQLQNAASIAGASISSAFATVVARVGSDVQSAQLNDKAQRNILDDALTTESSVSGVNLDEEASRLIQYQQQYQAAAKLIATAKAMFDTIVSLGG
jgi:flagellar hook-associated protein 1 FlgK